MPISSNTLNGLLRSNLQSNGITLTGKHAKAGKMALAVSKGVINEIHASAVVVVRAHAGGTYQVTGLSESAMSNKIKSELKGQGFVLTGSHARIHVLHEVVAKAVTTEIFIEM